MPAWAWIVVVIAVPLVLAKLYDWNAKRHGHQPGTGGEHPVDLTHYHPPVNSGDQWTGGFSG
jgi:hypothetical protein